MKRCPKCNETYDNNLNFCLTDGTSLSDINNSDPTLVLSPLSYNSSLSDFSAQSQYSSRKGVSPVFAYLSVGLLALIVGGGVVIFLRQDTKNSATADSSPKPSVVSNVSSTSKIESTPEAEVKTKPTLETKASPTATKTPDKIINFPASREGWYSIGSGNFILEVSGQIDIGGVTLTPKGWSKLGDNTALVAGLPFGAMIAKIGNGKPFLVGYNHKFDTQEQVYIAINDSDYSDNSGNFKVRIKWE